MELEIGWGEESVGVFVWIDEKEDDGVEYIELDFSVDIVDWEKVLDETVEDVVIVDGIGVVGW